MPRVIFALLFEALIALTLSSAAHAASWPAVPGDVVLHNFRFADGERLETLRMHYRTLGAPRRDALGHVTNAVLVLHGTGGSGAQFLAPQFADELYGPGQPLDITTHFVILPDAIGHGGSSKPSDGLKMSFPRYDYADMVAADYRLLTEGLKVDHLRLILGTSMGCMNAFVFGEAHPDFMDALMPLACLPVELAGRNRMWRQMTIDAIRSDPAWRDGAYLEEPQAALRTVADLLVIAGSAPLPLQTAYPTRAAAEAYEHAAVARSLAALDANDFLYQVDASRTYDPSARLGEIRARVMWINSADDFINPPELGIAEAKVGQIPHGRFRLIPASVDTHGHGSHTWAVLWKDDLKALLEETR